MTKSFWSTPKKPRCGVDGPSVNQRLRLFDWPTRYALAFAAVLLTALIVKLLELVIAFPPFLFLAIAVASILCFFGVGAGVFALAVATFVTDFYFVHPYLTLSLNGTVFGLCVNYFVGAVLSYIFLRYMQERSGSLRVL